MTDESHIDFEHLKRYVGDDTALMAEVFNLFKNQVDLWIPQLRSDLNDENWSMMAHSLKGTAHAIGALELAEDCEKAEALIGEGKRPGSREVMVDKIEGMIGQVLVEISRWEYRQTILKMKSD